MKIFKIEQKMKLGDVESSILRPNICYYFKFSNAFPYARAIVKESFRKTAQNNLNNVKYDL